MVDFINKLSRYDFFNHFITGYTFLFLVLLVTGADLPNNTLVVPSVIIVSYSTGFLFGGVGSLLVEPIAKGIVGFYDHAEYSRVAKDNEFIRILQSNANTSRTFVIEGIVFAIISLLPTVPIAGHRLEIAVSAFVIAVLFFLSYLKGISYVKKTIDEEKGNAS